LKKQSAFEYIIVILLGVLILNLMVYYYQICLGNSIRMGDAYFPYIMYSFFGVLFGVLIEWRKLKAIFAGNLSVNWLLLPSLVLLIVGLIPVFCYLYFFGLDYPYGIKFLGWIIDPLKYPVPRIPINVLSGIMIVRSLTDG